ncbi:SDR family oxidoreductase [Sphingobium aromaticiconvertens]
MPTIHSLTLPEPNDSMDAKGETIGTPSKQRRGRTMLAITGATGQLGRLVIAALLRTVPAGEIAALVRDVDKASDLAAKGVVVREADYNRPETLGPALAGVDKLLLISGNEVGHRVPQHKAVIDAAKTAGVKLIAYTSALHADTSPLGLAEEHRQTEALLRESALPTVLLRNSWYTENYTASIPAALQHGVMIGSAGVARIASATRADFANATAAVLVAPEDQAGRVYELAGDEAYTLAEFADELSRQTGKTITFQNLSEADYKAALVGAGLPEAVAAMLAQSDAAAGQGALFDDSHDLGRLIGRPTTPLKDAIAAALKG